MPLKWWEGGNFMEFIIIIILSITTIGFGFLYFINQKSIKKATNELREINSIDTNLQIKLYVPNKNLEELLLEINSLLGIKQKNSILHIRKEKELRQQIVNVSHDLRTPLTSILGYTELIKDKSYSKEEKMQYLDIIEKRSKVLQMLITSFYDLSRLEANEYIFNFETLNIHNILCEMVAAFYNNFTQKDFDIKIDLDENIPTIIADKKAVIRVITNLIQNALTHGIKTISISQKVQNGKVITSISNDTENFTEEDINHVFDRFFTGDKMRTSQSTGLGLTIVKRFVEEMGSKITATLDNHIFKVEIEWSNFKIR